jgi:hypothetical protein
MEGCLALTILGGVFEVTGLGLIAWEITRLQRQEFGLPSWWLKLEGRLRRLLRSERSSTVYLRGMDAAATSDAALELTVTSGPAVSLEDKVQRLEEVAEDLQRKLEGVTARFEREVAGVQKRLGKVEAERHRERQEQERTRKEAIRRQITVQAVGTVLFIIGAVLSVLGDAVSC